MDICTLCDDVIEGPRLGNADMAGAYHPACVAERLPQDAITALIATTLRPRTADHRLGSLCLTRYRPWRYVE